MRIAGSDDGLVGSATTVVEKVRVGPRRAKGGGGGEELGVRGGAEELGGVDGAEGSRRQGWVMEMPQWAWATEASWVRALIWAQKDLGESGCGCSEKHRGDRAKGHGKSLVVAAGRRAGRAMCGGAE